MDRIKGSMAGASSLQITEKAPYLDKASKEILSNKEFLAIILKYTVKEYADMEFKDIADCIEADSISRTAEVSPARANAGRITGVNTEFSVLDEVLTKFDILFKAVNPKLSNEETTYYLHLDIEPQNDYSPGYPIEKRGIYYMSRMISSQLVLLTEDTDYNGIEKVYSIWICRKRIPKALRNTMSMFEIKNTYNSKDISLNSKAYDLMTMVILRLGNPEDDNNEDIFKILNALFYPREQKSYEILKEYVDFSEVLAQEVKELSGLGESVFYEGVEVGIEKGVEKGVNQERCEIVKKLSKKMDAPYIAEVTELPIEEIEKILKQ